TSVILSQQRGAGANFDNTTFSDTAGTAIGAGASPFNGAFQPENPLSAFANRQTFGKWTLLIGDVAQNGIVGRLNEWWLELLGPGGTPLNTTYIGNQIDQNSNASGGEAAFDSFAIPNPTGGIPFQLPYVTDSLPLMVPGAHAGKLYVQSAVAVSADTIQV